MLFEVSGVVVPVWLPPLVAFAISLFTSMVGISGAFLLLPFQMSVLGYVAPSVSATNLVFNLVAIPAGVWRYAHEQRMDWPLAWVITAGTLPGLLAGWWLRVHWLPDPRDFKFFVGLVLLGLAVKLLLNRHNNGKQVVEVADRKWRAVPVLSVALVIGVVGGTYGIGGGAIMAPVLVAIFSMSIHGLAGATLFGTLVTSVAGVALYQFMPAPPGMATRPDWALGILFGMGGAAGMYAGARLQKHLPQRALEVGIALVLGLLASAYVVGYWLSASG
ncbi:MAG: sulfite exporter TauE/SafE family protein [Gammaproteobacteria bacterium]|nr:sulfite exporter TauE/SafE family protein [Rhodocyclaceae bacterium]MBU3908832.1 sulfite exporter TauE/SafE family protein [Gammaproteobacteria bacterium]MBU3987699.1 sulfite exporter TauE/SafE family protein [Gammaproteobacteria bacterium]MBU4003667.1 sulfite exporter TauE/SafE family protein [Gammaproteobacteria bacterium]MBU4021781.1 sulfite exporter TauE/SafE family protein [Gammaproteobacteria bacterium]